MEETQPAYLTPPCGGFARAGRARCSRTSESRPTHAPPLRTQQLWPLLLRVGARVWPHGASRPQHLQNQGLGAFASNAAHVNSYSHLLLKQLRHFPRIIVQSPPIDQVPINFLEVAPAGVEPSVNHLFGHVVTSFENALRDARNRHFGRRQLQEDIVTAVRRISMQAGRSTNCL